MTLEAEGYDALAAHWQYLHPVRGAEVAIWGDKVEALGIEEHTRLPVVTKKLAGEVRMVKNVIPDVCPKLVIVDDDGIYRACYDEKELDGWDTFVLSDRKITFRDHKWTLEVYEEFMHLPEAVTIDGDKAGIHLTWTQHKLPKMQAEFVDKGKKYSFPCPVYDIKGVTLEEEKVVQPSLPLNNKWKQDNTHPWKQSYNDGEWFSKQGGRVWTYPSVVTKATCGYESTEDYLEHVLGIKLHSSDRQWYVGNEAVIASGLPAEKTLDVLSELVYPYGVEIAEVWTDHAAWYSEWDSWANRLGKEDALYLMMKEAGADLPSPRWHIGPLPMGIPIISMSAGDEGGGHASYLGPRSARPTDYQMAMTFRRTK